MTDLSAPHVQTALTGLIDAIGREDFAARALAALNETVRAASWSVYRLHPQDLPPELHLSASRGVEDATQDCFRAYRDAGLYRQDRSFARLRPGGPPSGPQVLRMHGDEAPSPAHRELIYRRHRVVERLSVASVEPDGSLLAINLYHHEHQGRFTPAEQDTLAMLAPLVRSSVQRHLALARRTHAPASAADPRQRLLQACAALTPRELDVCERLLRGWSHDGIAADLGLTLSTVKTYRARAFERLGLHFRSELFARFGHSPH
ncbi:MAG: LuxR C-terminal-related transcriptional regulator [Sphaerotilus natans subsp. sulfidivorans]|uniref:helix-turn-helix transcriptional regulator n=1 Tax=Sphaerotilus sulfidivorans TaxID=639200 RepID=UPI002353C3AE|nr:LuxR C-terminal-related transcriptional regulator [Sphaerotilus sulfidivorans]MCK6401360.1 LuxR C-terminal-related transcriptional regulator [Sphaerotilus sulfidivorans]